MPRKALPFEGPVVLIRSPGAEIGTVTSAPGLGASPTSSKLRSTWGAASSPAFFAWPSSAFLARLFRRAPKPRCTAWSRTCTTRQGPAWMIDTGTAVPSSLKTRVMPSFRPMSPLVIGSPDLDLDIHPGGQVELGQRVHRLGPRVVDVHQALVGPELELLPALLVDVRTPEHRPPLGLDRQRDRPGDLRPGLLDGADDVRGRLVEDDVVEGFQSDADFASHGFSSGSQGAGEPGSQVGWLPGSLTPRLPTSRSSSPPPPPPSARPPGSRTAAPRPSRSA